MEIEERLKDFKHNIKTLRTFVYAVEPVLEREAKQKFKENGSDLAPAILLAHATDPNLIELSEEERAKMLEKYNLQITDKNTIKFNTAEGYKNFIQALEDVDITRKQTEMLYENSLVNLVVYFETLIGNLIKQHLTNFGDVKKKSLTFEQISQMGSLEEAKGYLLDKEVHDLMYQGFNDWITYLKKNLKLTMSYLDERQNDIVEIIQRRNVLIHNGGKINNIYLSKVHEEKRNGMSVDDKVIMTKEYLDDAINLIENMGILILLEYWKKKKPDDTKRGKAIVDLISSHLPEERWHLIKSYSFFLMKDNGLPEQFKLLGKVNFWQSHKWVGEFDKVKKDVMSADFSANRRDFQLCLFALQDKKRAFIGFLPNACPSDVTLESLKEWPIFKEMREEKAVQEFIKQQEVELEKLNQEVVEEIELGIDEVAAEAKKAVLLENQEVPEVQEDQNQAEIE